MFSFDGVIIWKESLTLPVSFVNNKHFSRTPSQTFLHKIFHDCRISAIIWNECLLKELWYSDAIWRQTSWLTLVNVKACCLMPPNHTLNQCWRIVNHIWGKFYSKFKICNDHKHIQFCATWVPRRLHIYLYCGHFYQHGVTLIPAWIRSHTSNKFWAEIIYPFPNFNCATVEVWEWTSIFIPV